jgi:hypothetical protein
MRLKHANPIQLIALLTLVAISGCGGNKSNSPGNPNISTSSSSNSSLLRSASSSSKKTTPPESNHAPIANVEVSTYGVTVFVDASKSSDPDQDDLTTTIDFGDGKIINYPNAWHTYFTEGSYKIDVTVQDGSLSNSFSKTIVAKSIPGNHAPVAILDTNYERAFGGVSEDVDADLLSYTFDFGIETTTGTNKTASVKSIACPTPPIKDHYKLGSGIVTMTVSDGQLSDTVQDNWELWCGAFFVEKGTTSDFVYRADGLTVYVDGRKSYYAWGFNWNFGDGSPVLKGAFSSHTYLMAGSYDITLHADTSNSFFNKDKTLTVAVGTQSSSASSK